jgi:type IV pilus assembly protein PilP
MISKSFGNKAFSQSAPTSKVTNKAHVQAVEHAPEQVAVPVPAVPVEAAPATTSESAATAINPLEGLIEDYTYSPEGKRDPFMPVQTTSSAETMIGPTFPLQRFDLDQLKLVGIIWDVKAPKAMLLDPNGKGHVIKVNERVGRNNGYVARIREGEIVVVESYMAQDGSTSYQTKIMKLVTEQ